MKKRVKILAILGVVCIIGIGLFSLSSSIVSRGYNSEDRLKVEEKEKKDKQKVVKLDNINKSIGNHGEQYSPGEIYDDGEPVYLKKIQDILNMDGSPYKGLDYEIQEEDLLSGEKKFSVINGNDVIIDIYGNDVDYSPYIFSSKDSFSSEEVEFFENLQNGQQGYNEETKEYYWVYN